MKGVNKVIFYLGLALLVAGPVPTVEAQTKTSSKRGAGPFVLKTKRGKVQVRLLRKDKKVLWVLRPSASGEMIETGISRSDIVSFQVPTPKLFLAARAVETSQQARKIQVRLEGLTKQLMPYREFPGMIVNEALLLQGKLEEKQEGWAKAATLYEELLTEESAFKFKQEAMMRAGLCYAHLEKHEEALNYLTLENLSDEDLSLVSEVYLARGDAYVALDQFEKALLSYLYLVVFHPYIDNNEARCLAAALPCYASLSEWESASKSAVLLNERYPGTPYAKAAEEFIKQYEQELRDAGVLPVPPDDPVEIKEEKGVSDDLES